MRSPAPARLSCFKRWELHRFFLWFTMSLPCAIFVETTENYVTFQILDLKFQSRLQGKIRTLMGYVLIMLFKGGFMFISIEGLGWVWSHCASSLVVYFHIFSPCWNREIVPMSQCYPYLLAMISTIKNGPFFGCPQMSPGSRELPALRHGFVTFGSTEPKPKQGGWFLFLPSSWLSYGFWASKYGDI